MLRIFTHNVGSEGLANLREQMHEACEIFNTKMRALHPAIFTRSSRAILASENASAAGFRDGNRVILCWGNSSELALHQSNLYLNTPEAIGKATNKKTFFAAIEEHNEEMEAEIEDADEDDEGYWSERLVSTVLNTTSIAEARRWFSESSDTIVYCRTSLQGHSGQGIVVANNADELVQAPLYTKGITGARREYRVHVYDGKVLFGQVKRRREGTEVNEDVRNLDGGWVFGVNNVVLSSEVSRNAIMAVKALGLTFGAVDIIAKGRAGQETTSFVLEVNTAPGQQGDTTLSKYSNAIFNSIVDFYMEKTGARLTHREYSLPLKNKLISILNFSDTDAERIVNSLPSDTSVAQVDSESEDAPIAPDLRSVMWERASLTVPDGLQTMRGTTTMRFDTTRDGMATHTSVATPVREEIPTAEVPSSIIRTSVLTAPREGNYYAVGTVAGVVKVGMVVPSRGVFYMVGIDSPVSLTNVELTARIEL